MTKRIEIVDSSQDWASEFRTIAEPLRSALGDLALRIDHIGSTSVPGLPAKDVIDIQVTVAELDREAISAALAPLGYSCREDVVGDHVPPGADAKPGTLAETLFPGAGRSAGDTSARPMRRSTKSTLPGAVSRLFAGAPRCGGSLCPGQAGPGETPPHRYGGLLRHQGPGV